MSRGGPTFDQERISVNLARLRKGGENFEIVIDADKAVAYKQGQQDDIRQVLKAEKIFFDAKKGELAGETHMETVFGTQDAKEIAKKILDEGDIQLTKEHRERIQEAKRKQIIRMIHMNAVNPSTGLVHPEERIRLAFDEARIKIDPYRTADQQVKEITDKLLPVIPIKFTTFTAEINLPATHAAKLYGVLEHYGKIVREEWLSDGSLDAAVELPAGRYNGLVDELSSKTHGNVQITKHEK